MSSVVNPGSTCVGCPPLILSASGSGPPTPTNAYVAEDGSTFYVAEDGSTVYVQES